MLNGRDVSSYQGSYTWPDGLGFGFAKATEGDFFQDPTFTHNWSALASKKYLRGAYHFAHPGTSATTQAQYFVNFVKAHGAIQASDALALDLEASDGKTASEVAAWAVEFVNEVKSLTGKNVIVYTMESFITGGYCAGLYSQPLWLAYPNGKPGTLPDLSKYWKAVTFQQYGTVSNVDADVLFGTVATWDAIVNVPTVKKTTTATVPAVTEVKETPEMISGQLTGNAFIPFPEGSFSRVMIYRDFLSKTAVVKVRVAANSLSKGYKVDEITVDAATPASVVFAEKDVNAVSIELVEGSLSPVGYTIA